MTRLYPGVRSVVFRRAKSKALFVDAVIVRERTDHIERLQLHTPVEVLRNTVRFFNEFERQLKWSLEHVIVRHSRRVSTAQHETLSALEYLKLFVSSTGTTSAEQIEGGTDENLLTVQLKGLETSENVSQSQQEYSLMSKEPESQASMSVFNQKPEKEYSSDSERTTFDAEILRKELRLAKRRVLPEQVIFLSDWEKFTTRVKHHIAEKKLNKLRGEVNKQRVQLVSALREDKTSLPRPLVESAIERSIWKEEILKRLLQNKVQSSDDFEWKKHPKYFVIRANTILEENDSKDEAPAPRRSYNLFVSLGSLTVEYGFELLSAEGAHGLSSLGVLNAFRDRSFVMMANCLKFRRPSLVVNDRFIENSVLAFGQLCGLPVIISAPCAEGRSLAEYSDFLVKSLEFGGVHLFKGLEQDVCAEFLESVLSVLELVEETFTFNKNSMELFDQSINISKHFLFVGAFNGSRHGLRPPCQEHLTRLRNRFREVSVSRFELVPLLELVFAKKNFSTGSALANKLFVLVNELEQQARLARVDWTVDVGLLLDALNLLTLSNGDHAAEQEAVLETVSRHWLKRVGLRRKWERTFLKEAQQVLSRALRSQSEIKERIEFELENMTGSHSENLLTYNQAIENLKAAYGLPAQNDQSTDLRPKPTMLAETNGHEKMYKTSVSNKLNSQSQDPKRVQSNMQQTGTNVQSQSSTEEDALHMREQLVDCFRRRDNLFKMKGQGEDRRPIVLVGDVFAGKSRTLSNFQRLVDSRRGGKTRVTRVFPGAHAFDELFGQNARAETIQEGPADDNKMLQELLKHRSRVASREPDPDSDHESGARHCKSHQISSGRANSRMRWLRVTCRGCCATNRTRGFWPNCFCHDVGICPSCDWSGRAASSQSRASGKDNGSFSTATARELLSTAPSKRFVPRQEASSAPSETCNRASNTCYGTKSAFYATSSSPGSKGRPRSIWTGTTPHRNHLSLSQARTPRPNRVSTQGRRRCVGSGDSSAPDFSSKRAACQGWNPRDWPGPKSFIWGRPCFRMRIWSERSLNNFR